MRITLKRFLKIIMLCLVFLTGQTSYSQSNKENALDKARLAIRLMDEEGKYDDAIKLLEEAEKLDPENIIYPYEIAFAYQAKKDYKQAAKILEKLLSHKDVYGRVYQLLGNTYDHLGDPDKAIKTYEKGLTLFPDAGELYLELGNMNLPKKEYNKALTYYEKGIQADPEFPSNYYWASKIYCNSTEEVWGMIYGEIFMNMERNSNRTAEISKLLFDTYKSEIKFTSDTSMSVSFSKNVINLEDMKDPNNIKLPFGLMIYEPGLTLSIIGEKSIDLNSLDRIRKRFVDYYFKGDNAKKYPNILFEYQQKVLTAGHFEAYNHWILMKGNETEFATWQSANKEKWDNFVAWFGPNRMLVDSKNKFHRTQY